MADDSSPVLGAAHDILANLPLLVRATRDYQGLTLRELGALTGVPFTSISRFERGSDIYLSSAVKLLAWLACRPLGEKCPARRQDGE